MLLLVYGTRPEWIKIKPIVKLLELIKANFKILFTGQHTTIADGHYDYKLDIRDSDINRLNNVFGSIFNSKEIENINPDYVLVQGDTATVCAVALKYYNMGRKIIHLEAGLRTYDLENPYPEEAYRQMVSRISSINLCPTQNNAHNIFIELCKGQNYIVGNTVLDNIADVVPTYQNQILCTLHRRENHCVIQEWFKEINDLAESHSSIEFLLPIHPNPNVLQHRSLLTHVKVVEPLSHENLIEYLKDCKVVITDSGGIQEEATFLQKKVIVCRKESERLENSGHLHLCKTPSKLHNIFNSIIRDYSINEKCPYGDGKSSERIVEIFKTLHII